MKQQEKRIYQFKIKTEAITEKERSQSLFLKISILSLVLCFSQMSVAENIDPYHRKENLNCDTDCEAEKVSQAFLKVLVFNAENFAKRVEAENKLVHMIREQTGPAYITYTGGKKCQIPESEWLELIPQFLNPLNKSLFSQDTETPHCKNELIEALSPQIQNISLAHFNENKVAVIPIALGVAGFKKAVSFGLVTGCSIGIGFGTYDFMDKRVFSETSLEASSANNSEQEEKDTMVEKVAEAWKSTEVFFTDPFKDMQESPFQAITASSSSSGVVAITRAVPGRFVPIVAGGAGGGVLSFFCEHLLEKYLNTKFNEQEKREHSSPK